MKRIKHTSKIRNNHTIIHSTYHSLYIICGNINEELRNKLTTIGYIELMYHTY